MVGVGKSANPGDNIKEKKCRIDKEWPIMHYKWFGTNLEKSIQTPSTGKKYLESDLTVDFAKFSLFLFLKITSLQMIEGAIFFLLIDKRAW